MTCGAARLCAANISAYRFYQHMRAELLVRLGLMSCLALGFACSDSTGPGVKLAVAPDAIYLVRNDSAHLSVNALDAADHLVTGVVVEFASNDTTIVTVTNLGVVHSHGTLGSTVVRVRGGGAFFDVPVVVTGTPTSVAISPADTALAMGTTAQFHAVVLDETSAAIPGVTVSWISYDTSLVTISSTGLVAAKSKTGDAFIGASYGGRSGTTTVTVLDSMVIARTRLPSRPHAAAIFGNIAYVTQLDAASASRANFPSRAFASSVPVGSTPTGVAFNAAGTRAYVTNQYSSSVSVVNVSTNTTIDNIPVGNRPFEIIVAPGDSILYVAKIDSVYGVRLSTKAIIARFPIPEAGNGIAIARDTLLYVSTHVGGTVVEFNLRTRTVTRTFAVGGDAQKMAVSPDGNLLYIANQAGYVQFWNIDSGLQDGATVTLPSAGYGLARRPSNGLLYVSSAYFGGGYIYVIDPVARTLLHSSIVGGSTRHIVFTVDGSIGIVANEGGWVDFLR